MRKPVQKVQHMFNGTLPQGTVPVQLHVQEKLTTGGATESIEGKGDRSDDSGSQRKHHSGD